MATTYENYGTVYGNTKSKMVEIETALNNGGFAIAYNDDGQNGVIIKATVTEDETTDDSTEDSEVLTSVDVNNFISGETAPEAVAEPVLVTDDSETTEDSTDDTSTETSNE